MAGAQVGKEAAELLGKHMIPVVLGPDGHYYVVDHHHLARALHDEGVENVLVTVIGDLTMVERDAFWTVMDHKRWAYPYDVKGERRHFKDLPKSVSGLKDDPFRSLAGELRRVGGFAKDTTPFSEFLWADFLRRKISRKSVDENFDKAMEKALSFARARTRCTCQAGADPSIKQRLCWQLVREGVRRFLPGLVLAAKPLVQPAFHSAANGQDREGDDQCDDHHSPLSEAADNSDAGRQPGAGGAGEPANPEMTSRVDNDAGAEKADPGQDSLHHPAAGVRDDFGLVRMDQHQQHGRRKADQRQRLQSDRLAVQIAVETDQPPASVATPRRSMISVQSSNAGNLRAQPCFGSRPIM
jgi:hypothetical protein